MANNVKLNSMLYLEIVKRDFEKELTLTIAKRGEMVFEPASHGISSVLNVIEKFGKGSTGGSVVDRIVGEAMALLCVCAEIKSACALTLCREVKRVLKENAVYVE